MTGFTVDQERCVQCGLCVQDCLASVLGMEEYPVMKNDEGCIRGQHCLAVCPTAAVTILGNDTEDSTPLKGNLPQPEQMATLIKGRRSTRSFKPEELPAETLREVMDICWHAPTGVNVQQVQLTVTSGDDTRAFSKEVFTRLAQMVQDGGLPGGIVGNYYTMAHNLYQEHGVDIIFRNAPHTLFATAPAQAPSPTADTHIFLSYFDLMAPTMGIGTLWNGLLKWAVSDIFPDLRERLGIPADHEIGYAMVFGKPAVKYQRTVERGQANLNLVNWK
jgi:nitroreductase/NAD-dependent dihydropyrimidine dehydrogenase PreA subunit